MKLLNNHETSHFHKSFVVVLFPREKTSILQSLRRVCSRFSLYAASPPASDMLFGVKILSAANFTDNPYCNL